ncbi:type II toxin-antitoxin system VapC family toxin [Undibacterium sp. RTI2.1]|uniref:type II toxin-antitoxin system VapC family toxin n=1 Tax=unclassified Undibacterium TaxID=2630295 RepID=UPI002B22284E|nr:MULTISPECIES: type II toxin-antitoxin system VapC family toxin [unclassified Undibacterium]MEB0032901.1 type II toxin-antitoxin system VapC family toxin [Undibacterium sp. RTI2.1]MEB0118806.1 type II toxin-antitoxin system VapC family toxin [Undibacterium sp. RTI2.2]
MRILLDTHVYLWWLQDSTQLSKSARHKIMTATEVYVSSASIWEVAIKVGIGKLDVDVDVLVAEIVKNGFQELSVTPVHAAKVRHLPVIHRDPFDRILIAQALCEPLQLLTADGILSGYSELIEMV